MSPTPRKEHALSKSGCLLSLEWILRQKKPSPSSTIIPYICVVHIPTRDRSNPWSAVMVTWWVRLCSVQGRLNEEIQSFREPKYLSSEQASQYCGSRCSAWEVEAIITTAWLKTFCLKTEPLKKIKKRQTYSTEDIYWLEAQVDEVGPLKIDLWSVPDRRLGSPTAQRLGIGALSWAPYPNPSQLLVLGLRLGPYNSTAGCLLVLLRGPLPEPTCRAGATANMCLKLYNPMLIAF